MMCPFQPSEKQALLEAVTLVDRADVMVALLEMSLAANDDTASLHKNRSPAGINDMSDNITGIDPKLLEILVCPLTKGPLDL